MEVRTFFRLLTRAYYPCDNGRLRKVLGNKKTAVYVSLVIIYSTIAGLLFGMM